MISANSHYNNVAIFIYKKKNKYYIKKCAMSAKANQLIKNEYNGYKYFNSISSSQVELKIYDKILNEIDIPFFQGNNFAHDLPYPNNQTIILNIINFYNSLWVKKGKIPIHGDLGLNNIIMKGYREFYVIDWEHLHYNDEKYFGFDIVHMLFLNMYKNFKNLKKHEVTFLKNSIELLFKNVGENNKIKKNPFVNSQKYMLENEKYFCLNVPIYQKFAFARYPQEILKKIDNLFYNEGV